MKRTEVEEDRGLRGHRLKKPKDEEGMDWGEQRVKRTKVGQRKKQNKKQMFSREKKLKLYMVKRRQPRSSTSQVKSHEINFKQNGERV